MKLSRRNFQLTSLGSIEDSDWRFPEFHADLSCYKEMRVHCTRYEKKLPPFSPPILRPCGPGRLNFHMRFEFSLHTPVKFVRIR